MRVSTNDICEAQYSYLVSNYSVAVVARDRVSLCVLAS